LTGHLTIFWDTFGDLTGHLTIFGDLTGHLSIFWDTFDWPLDYFCCTDLATLGGPS